MSHIWECESCGWVNHTRGKDGVPTCSNCSSRDGEPRNVAVIVQTVHWCPHDRNRKVKRLESAKRQDVNVQTYADGTSWG